MQKHSKDFEKCTYKWDSIRGIQDPLPPGILLLILTNKSAPISITIASSAWGFKL